MIRFETGKDIHLSVQSRRAHCLETTLNKRSTPLIAGERP